MLELALISFGIIGSVALFVYSISSFNRVIKAAVGERFRNLLRALTSRPLKGAVVGTVATIIFQSSSATSVLVASLVDAGYITFFSSLGVIFGVNVGTTITSQLIAFDVMSVSPYIVIAGLIVYWWGGTFRKYGKPIIYFGLLFFSIYLISLLVQRIDPLALAPMVALASKPVLAIVLGAAAAVLFQSSAAVSVMVLVLAGAGLIDLPQSVGLILGANIGTTSTVIIGSLAMKREGKKVALAHFLFNFFGVLIVLPFLNLFYSIVRFIDGDLVHQIANIHLIFNIFVAAIFLLAVRPFGWVVQKLIR